jgi:dipeptidyl-peptidase-4
MAMRRSFLCFCFLPLALVESAALAAEPSALTAPAALTTPPQLTFDLLFGHEPAGAWPDKRSWSPDGRTLAYRWDDGSGDALFLLDAESGSTRKALVLEELVMDEYRWSPRGDALLLVVAGDLYLHDLGSNQTRRLTKTEEEEEDPEFSPDGTQVSFVRGFDLYLLDLASGSERALTQDGKENATLNGTTDWVYWEEIWSRNATGYWWSPDGRRIAFYRFDESPVSTYSLVDFLPLYPEVTPQKYPKAGTANPKVQIGVVDVASGRTTWLQTDPDPTTYLARVHWRSRGDRVAVQRLNREQTRLDLLLCDPESGACSELARDEHPTWVNLGDELTFLPDDRFLWSSEREGFRRLYLHGTDGRVIRPLSPADRALTSLDVVDGEAGWAIYTTYGTGSLGAARREVHRVAFDGSPPQNLTPTAGWNDAPEAAPTGDFVHRFSTADQPEELAVVTARGRRLPLPHRQPPFDPGALPRWELLQIPGPGGVPLPARLLKPAGFDPQRRYPVLMYHYGGPASQVVADRWDSRGLWHKMMAERGYLVLSVDNELSVFFGKAGEDKVHRRFGPFNLAAQLAGVEYLKTLPYADPERIGLWGWSGGGSNTLYCLLNSPGTWKAGMAGAPVTDWRLYDTIWTERYLDHPDDNPEGYRLSSATTHAANLKDALLVVHGTGDDNVHPQNTVVLSQALIEAGRLFEQGIYPVQKHSFGDKTHERHFYERMTEFFDRHLRGGG